LKENIAPDLFRDRTARATQQFPFEGNPDAFINVVRLPKHDRHLPAASPSSLHGNCELEKLVLRSDNGPEFISHKVGEWCARKGIEWRFIQPGKPTQNAFVERQNGSMRRELLDAYLFDTLNEALIICEEWRRDYNEERPHKALGYRPPVNYRLL
jgi:transposase InsO family protein